MEPTKIMNSNNTQSTEDSTIISIDKSKISNLEIKISHLTEYQLQHTSGYKYIPIQNAEITATMANNIQNLTAQISALAKMIDSQNDQFINASQSLKKNTNNIFEKHNIESYRSTEVLRK